MKLLFLSVMILMSASAQKRFLLNTTCQIDKNCFNSASIGLICGPNQLCLCGSSYVLSKNADKCLGGLGKICRYDDNCIEGAFCRKQEHCECKDDLYPSEDGLACSKSKQFVSCKPHVYLITGFLLHLLKVI